jgi:hypothetical protein
MGGTLHSQGKPHSILPLLCYEKRAYRANDHLAMHILDTFEVVWQVVVVPSHVKYCIR